MNSLNYKYKKLIALVAVFMGFSLQVNAALIKETWSVSADDGLILLVKGGTLDVSEILPSRTFEWTITYDDSVNSSTIWDDGPNGIGEFGQGDDSVAHIITTNDPASNISADIELNTFGIFEKLELYAENNGLITEDIFSQSFSRRTDFPLGDRTIFHTLRQDSKQFQFAHFFNQTRSDHFFLGLNLAGGNANNSLALFLNAPLGSSSKATLVSTELVQVNEPSTLFILLAGFISIALKRRVKKTKI